MKNLFKRPKISEVILKDGFWTPYTEGIRDVMLPYCFDKFEETSYIANFRSVAAKDGAKHIGPPFSDGLVLETVRAACDFLKGHPDKAMEERLDLLIETILSAQQEDGFLCTQTLQDYPDKRWGENGGDIIIQHDLYDQGALVEAGISHYVATGKTTLLEGAVRSAKLISSYIGEPPKHNLIPGHSLPEEAFIKLYRLFRDDRGLDGLAKKYGVECEEFLEVARFWYDNRGIYEGRDLSHDERYGPEYNQDTAPFARQRIATGHAVRACLCYSGAATLAYELSRDDYKEALDAIWYDVTRKKLHISGGVGSRHDIEGFDKEYDLPNNAYLETCAGTAFAFWAGEMSLLERKSEYYDYFELSLYNNILGSVGKDFKTYYYDNALVNDGTKNRWSWHGCPCCPPMLGKFYSSLSTYIYSFREGELCVNMYIGSEYENGDFAVSQSDKAIRVNAKNGGLTVFLRVPEYALDFKAVIDGREYDLAGADGYIAVPVSQGESEILVNFSEKTTFVYASGKVEADIGRVCIMSGAKLMCVEGIDNGGEVKRVIASDAKIRIEKDGVSVEGADGERINFIPYYLRNNRVSDNAADSAMAVWLLREGFGTAETRNGELYGRIEG